MTAGQQPWARAAIWLPGLAVAIGAAAATVHGLYEVALASRVPAGIAWLYPLITDGLALVAYAATTRLCGPAARYAWSVVGIAAGLSGVAQAAYLAGGPTVEVAAALRFGVGAWPALAAAVVAHLLYLLAVAESAPAERSVEPADVQPFSVHRGPVQPGALNDPAVLPERDDQAVQPRGIDGDVSTGQAGRPTPSPARDRAASEATCHAHRHGAWPTVAELEAAAEVSRGTAAAVLKTLRAGPLPLHLITESADHAPDDHHEAHQ